MTDALAAKIQSLTNFRLEAEIMARNRIPGLPPGDRILRLLWDEFDRRIESGEMTDDWEYAEELLNDTTKY